MARLNQENTVITKCLQFLYVDKDLDKFLSILDVAQKEDLTERGFNWILNAINYIEATQQISEQQLIKLQKIKLQILTDFLETYSFYSSFISDYENPELKEVFMENEFGVIHKRYLPKADDLFQLPKDGETTILSIRGDIDACGHDFNAKVRIDSKGYTLEVIKEPYSVSSVNDTDFKDIYTSLFNDALSHDIN